MASLRRPLARFLYRTLYSLIYVVLLVLMLVTPGDAIDQALRAPLERQYYIIWVVAVCWVLTLAIVTFIYALRLYGNGSALAAIPKAWVPVAPGDVTDRVYKVIEAGLERSASIAWRARPRALSKLGGGAGVAMGMGMGACVATSAAATRPGTGVSANSGIIRGSPSSSQSSSSPPSPRSNAFPASVANVTTTTSRVTSGGGSARERRRQEPGYNTTIALETPTPIPVWGGIEHYGWTSPNSTTLPPLLCYHTIVSELPTLAEAKALTMAPPAPNTSAFSSRRQLLSSAASLTEQPPLPDPAAVDLLTWSDQQSMREYLGHLGALGVVSLGPTVNSFLALYEAARFSTQPLSNASFRELMHRFADLLRSMRPLDPGVVRAHQDDDEAGLASEYGSFDDDGGDIDNDGPLSEGPSTPQSAHRSRAAAYFAFSGLGAPRPPGNGLHLSSANTWNNSTATAAWALHHHHHRPAPATPRGDPVSSTERSTATPLAPSIPPTPPRLRAVRTEPLASSSPPASLSSPSRAFAPPRTARRQPSARSVRGLSRAASVAPSFVTNRSVGSSACGSSRSGSSSPGGSVIRLAMDGEDAGGLPYVIMGGGW